MEKVEAELEKMKIQEEGAEKENGEGREVEEDKEEKEDTQEIGGNGSSKQILFLNSIASMKKKNLKKNF